MACLFPVGTYKMSGELTLRPCGMCKKCRLEIAKSWSVRIIHESKMHVENCFITLTFNDQNLPEDGSIRKNDIVYFIKKLRKSIYPKKIRFYACGEYGDVKFRPHYHLLIFGYDFPDKEIFKAVPKGEDCYHIYISEKLSSLWDKGFSTVADLTMETALYTARYVQKKITGSNEHALRIKKDRYGSKHVEFALMSRMPGIGATWFDEFGNDVYPKDFVTINGRKFKPPRYYDSLYARKNPIKFEKIKQKREEKTELAFPDEQESCNRHQFYEKLTKVIEREI